MLETLVDVDFDGKLKPCLATSWELKSPTSWKFTLRPGVKFHDGTNMDSKAVKFVLDRLAVNSKPIPISSVEIPSDNEVIINTSKPFVEGTIGVWQYDDRIKALKGFYNLKTTAELGRCFIDKRYHRR
nr:ABC transporter substrate-binding protein [Aceticella autotrophica]